MLKNQHRYDEISADRSIPIPHQPPHLLQFDILMFPNRNEIFGCWMFDNAWGLTKNFKRVTCVVVVKTFKISTAERVPSECN